MFRLSWQTLDDDFRKTLDCKYSNDSACERHSTNTDPTGFWKRSSSLASKVPAQTPFSTMMNAVQILAF